MTDPSIEGQAPVTSASSAEPYTTGVSKAASADDAAPVSSPSHSASSSASPRRERIQMPGVMRRFSDPQQSAARVLLIGRMAIVCITLAFVGLMARVWQLQAIPPDPIARLIDSQVSRQPIIARRANIEDRHGRPMAITRVIKSMFVDPQVIEDPGTFSERIGYTLEYDPAQIEKTIAARQNRRYVLIDKHLNEDRLIRLPELGKLKGLGLESRLIRDYPQATLAGQVIGQAGSDGHGIDGVEKTFDRDLNGTPGKITYDRDAGRRPLWIDNGDYVAPIDGKPVRLTLDLTIQAITERELAAACQKYGAESGQMVVMDPRNGEILALANYPLLDPNDFGRAKPDIRRNRPVTDTYEPGSTFKPFVWAIATESGAANPNEVMYCHNGFYVSPSGRRLRDAHGHGNLTWDEVLVESSNIGMAIVGQRMGADKLYDACRRFGFGQNTHCGLPGEVNGKLRPAKQWTHYSVTSIPMGQEVSVTAMQMARGFCAFANGGLLVSPTIRMRETGDPSIGAAPITERILTAKAANKTREVLRRVVSEGTGRKADSPMYTIWGKTGTAQVSGPRGGYIPDAYNASFVCGAPYDNPRVVIACVVHRPDKRKGHFGGTVAAPAARVVIEEALPYLGIAPLPVEADDSHKAQLVRG